MADAFILGAGFSKSIALTMPLTKDLGEQSLQQLKDAHGSRVRPDQHSDVCDGISCDGSTPLPTFVSGALDFEEWLSTLAESQPFLLPPENARRQALFSELTGSISTVIDWAVTRTVQGNRPPEWLSQLVMGWHLMQCQVVTFNYDTLIEATVDYLTLAEPETDRQLRHAQVGPSVIPIANEDFRWNGIRLPAAKTFQYLKLHGSTHWYWDDVTKAADSIVQIGIRHEWEKLSPSFTDEDREFRAPGKVPMIVPPITVKSTYFGNPIIRHLWHTAFFGLGMARRVFVFGYSLPPGDMLVRSMLAEILSNKEVWVINPDPKVTKRFAALKPRSLNDDFGSGRCDPSEFVAAYLS